MRGHLKLTTVLIVVVLALTGFSPAKSGGGKGGGKGSSGGGGCSKKSHGSSSAYQDYDDDDYEEIYGSDSYDSEPTESSSADSEEASATIVACVGADDGDRKKGRKKPRSTKAADAAAEVRVTSKLGERQTFRVRIDFFGAGGTGYSYVDVGSTRVTLEAGQTKTVKVPMEDPKQASRVRYCEIDDVELVHF